MWHGMKTREGSPDDTSCGKYTGSLVAYNLDSCKQQLATNIQFTRSHSSCQLQQLHVT
jgi:hypothetical protein